MSQLKRWQISNGKIKAEKPSGELIKIIEALNQFSSCPKSGQRCSKCCSVLNWMEGHFWLAGTDFEWTVPLPYCPTCEPDVPTAIKLPAMAA
jgi:hypothetical protein